MWLETVPQSKRRRFFFVWNKELQAVRRVKIGDETLHKAGWQLKKENGPTLCFKSPGRFVFVYIVVLFRFHTVVEEPRLLQTVADMFATLV